jgi:hypothetical protein
VADLEKLNNQLAASMVKNYQRIGYMTEPELVDAEVNSLIKSELMGSRLTRDQRMQLLFINFMRCNPKKFASECLEKFRQRFQ